MQHPQRSSHTENQYYLIIVIFKSFSGFLDSLILLLRISIYYVHPTQTRNC